MMEYARKIMQEIMQENKVSQCVECGCDPVLLWHFLRLEIVCPVCGFSQTGDTRQKAVLRWNTMQDTRG